jgi:hypothetical protein
LVNLSPWVVFIAQRNPGRAQTRHSSRR